MPSFRHLPSIAGGFTATLLLSNLLAVKIFTLGSVPLPAGILVFPIAYIFGDILTEVYGYAATRRVVWTGFVALLASTLAIEIAKALPPAPFWQGQDAFETAFAQTPRIVMASMAAYVCGEFLNAYVLAKMKVRLAGRRMGWRFVASTLVGEGADTAVFSLAAFSGVMPLEALVRLALATWLGKVLWEIAALPFSLRLAAWLKKAEGLDADDAKTDFNPFRWAD